MSRLHNDANNEYLNANGNPIGASPTELTLSGWIDPQEANADAAVLGIWRPATSSEGHIIQVRMAFGYLQFQSRTSSIIRNAATTNAPTLNAWNHCVGRLYAADSRDCVLNGDIANRGTNSQSVTVGGLGYLRSGAYQFNGPVGYVRGRLCELAIWDVALTDGEVIALAAGVPACRIRPQNLGGYWPIRGIHDNEPDCTDNGIPFATVNDPVLADHAPIAPGHSFDVIQYPPVAAVPGITGTADQTMAPMSQSAAGIQVHVGSAVQVLLPTEQAAAGTQTFLGAAAQDLAATEQAATGVQGIAGDAAQDLAATEQLALGGQVFTGVAAQFLAAMEQAAQGEWKFSGAAAQILAAVEQSAVGAIAGVFGTAVQDLGATEQAAAGGQVFQGSAAQDLAPASQDVAGLQIHLGVGDQFIAAMEQAAMGIQGAVGGAAAQDLATVIQAALGAQIFSGDAAQDLAATEQLAIGGQVFTGAADQTLAATLQQAFGVMHYVGVADQLLTSTSQAAIGVISGIPDPIIIGTADLRGVQSLDTDLRGIREIDKDLKGSTNGDD